MCGAACALCAQGPCAETASGENQCAHIRMHARSDVDAFHTCDSPTRPTHSVPVGVRNCAETARLRVIASPRSPSSASHSGLLHFLGNRCRHRCNIKAANLKGSSTIQQTSLRQSNGYHSQARSGPDCKPLRPATSTNAAMNWVDRCSSACRESSPLGERQDGHETICNLSTTDDGQHSLRCS